MLSEHVLMVRLLREDWAFSFEEIAGYWNEKGILSPRGNQWSRTSVYNLYQYWWVKDGYTRRYYAQEIVQHANGKVFSRAMYPV